MQIKVALLKPLSILLPEALVHGILEKNGKNLKEDVQVFKIYSTILKVPFANVLCS